MKTSSSHSVSQRHEIYARFALVIFSILFSYLLAEGAASTYRWLVPNSGVVYFTERNATKFDPISGYRFSREARRFRAMIGNEVLYDGAYKGNAQGFPDRHDFTPRRTSDERRYAVLGDSFSAGQFLDTGINWPDRVEEIFGKEGKRVSLLNFSLPGIGLANWRQILVELIAREEYDLDGIIFAVFSGDLDRRYMYADYSHGDLVTQRRIESWDPRDVPVDASVALPLLAEAAMPGNHLVEPGKEILPQVRDSWKPVLYPEIFRFVRVVGSAIKRFFIPITTEHQRECKIWHCGQIKLIEEIAQLSRHKGWSIKVVHIYEPTALSGRYPYDDHLHRSLQFATMLGVPLIDGGEPFRPLTSAELDKDFFKLDSHWNARGSDRFAAFMHQVLSADLAGK